MTPADRLIVAPNLPPRLALAVMERIITNTAVRRFKIGRSTLFQRGGHELAAAVVTWGELMLDLKIWDTPDTVKRDVTAAFELGARFVTIAAEDDVVAAAMEAVEKGGFINQFQLLVVGNLTSNPSAANMAGEYVERIGGAVIPQCDIRSFRRRFPQATFMVPGIRLIQGQPDVCFNDHHSEFGVTEPHTAIRNGADYVIVGRPIAEATNPVAATRLYMEDIARATG